jgi:hypothetical protein
MTSPFQKDYYQEYLKLKKENIFLKRILRLKKENILRFQEKIKFVLSFLSFLTYERQRYILPKPGIYGCFVRKIFEFILDPENIPKNNCIDFYLGRHLVTEECKNIVSRSDNLSQEFKLEQELKSIIQKLDIQLGIYLTTKSEEIRPKFGNFYYEGSNRVKTNESRDSYHLHFMHQNNNNHLEVLIHSCIKEIEIDSNVNSLILSTSGIEAINGFNFLNVLDSIFNKKATLGGYSFNHIENKIWNQGLIRDEKVELLSKHINYIKFSCLGLMDAGYKLHGYQIPEIKIEDTEDCNITGIKPPYPTIILNCNHSISLMAYFGIIYRSESEFTESIRCPICRGDLSLKLETKENVIQLYTPYFDNFIKQAKNYKNFKSISRINFYNICSSDSLEDINSNSLDSELKEEVEDDESQEIEDDQEEIENIRIPVPIEIRDLIFTIDSHQDFQSLDVD